jgi:hypothetical protein
MLGDKILQVVYKVWHPLLAFELILAIKIYFPDLFGGSEHSPAIPAIHPTRLHKRHLKN